MRRTCGVVLALGLLALAIPATAGAAKTATPGSLAFPATEIDAESAAQTVTVGIGATDLLSRTTSAYITNCSTTPCAGGGQACSPKGFCPFKIVTNNCPAAFPMGDQTCSIGVASTPYDFARLGTWYGTLEIGPGWPSVSLSGIATLGGTKGGKKKKCGKKKGKGKKRSATAAKKGCKKGKKKK